MIKIEDERYVGGTPYASVLEVSGIMGALHGMRNPKNSWRLADSYINENGEFKKSSNGYVIYDLIW